MVTRHIVVTISTRRRTLANKDWC